MKKTLFYSFLLILITACSSNSSNNSNANIPNITFNTGNAINTSLPQYNDLLFANNSIELYNYGFNGISIYSEGNNVYRAYELTDPNHQANSCSRLSVNETIATCDCDDGNSYTVITGQAFDGTTGQFILKPYFVEVSGNIIRVYNN